jgi:hypothetical protein
MSSLFAITNQALAAKRQAWERHGDLFRDWDDPRHRCSAILVWQPMASLAFPIAAG